MGVLVVVLAALLEVEDLVFAEMFEPFDPVVQSCQEHIHGDDK